jgi:hypothetical protein
VLIRIQIFFILPFLITPIPISKFWLHDNSVQEHRIPLKKIYYLSQSGNDNNDGSKDYPLKSISKLNAMHLAPGNAIYLHGGDTFEGSILLDSSKSGTAALPILIGSYGKGKAVISSGNLSAIIIYKSSNIHISNLKCVGSGRKSGNTKEGLIVMESKNVIIDSIEISGFQKAGLLIYSSKSITTRHVYSHDNGAAGITVEGNESKKDSREIYIGYCRAENNPGDPTILTNHSGNGIVVGHCTKVTIEYCEATNNGWDMPRIGNGPVGIWGYEADSLVIQHCLSYRNKTSPGAADGGGFDLDGGVTNSVVQYCLSYENQGAGYCIFQYWGASPWYNNVFRYNISVDDGLVSDGFAGVYVWNSSGDENQFHDCLFYNNTIYNSQRTALHFSEKSKRKKFAFYNNIFVGKDSLMIGNEGSDIFLANDWWSITKKFNIEGIYDFSTWARENNKEITDGNIIGLNTNPNFENRGNKMPITTADIHLFDQYTISKNSPLRMKGLDLHELKGIESGDFDFNRQSAPVKGIGASF